ncbi:MAG: Gfo/Idh/MocA family oxidoreductase [Gaiellaceae bacterium MAG52_C11]|nr:Gfo/Idh/MocA family oxidoreductase [Candidatus Gaiellasilicea maunaloa]
MRTPVAVGVVGATQRATALTRAFAELPQAELRWICDDLPRLSKGEPGTGTSWTTRLDDLLLDEELDAVVFASTELAGGGRALAALAADKHVLVEGPLAFTSAESDELVAVAERRSRRLMTHSPALLRPGVLRLHRLIDRGVLGEIFYVHATRSARREGDGPDVLWDLGIEAVALVLDLLGDQPVDAVARGESYLGLDRPDVVFASLGFATGIKVYLQLSRLDGETSERLSIVGSAATSVLDVSESRQGLSLYLEGQPLDLFDELALDAGGHIRFSLPADDSTRLGCSRFLTSVRSPNDTHSARKDSAAIAVVETLGRSCANDGTTETIAPRTERQEQNVIAFRG